MKVNGEQIELKEKITLESFLISQGYKIPQIAVELNEEIIPRENFGKITLNSNDVIEVVHFMGGGSI